MKYQRLEGIELPTKKETLFLEAGTGCPTDEELELMLVARQNAAMSIQITSSEPEEILPMMYEKSPKLETSPISETSDTWVDVELKNVQETMTPVIETLTRSLPSKERREHLVDFLIEQGKGQTLQQLIFGAMYMYPGERLPEDEYQKLVVNTIKNDIRALKDTIKIRKTKSKKGKTVHLYELIEWEIEEDDDEIETPTPAPTIPNDELMQMVLNAIEAGSREESNKILIGIVRKLTGLPTV